MARRAPAKRHAGLLVHRLLWSMAHGRAVRIELATGSKQTGRVVRIWRDQSQGSNEKGSQASTVGVVFDDGAEVLVNAIRTVMLPKDGTERAFVE